MQVEPDASLRIRERITFSFSGPFSGAYRDVPLRRGESISAVLVGEAGQPYKPGGNTELGSSGRPGTYGVERTPGRVRVVWHYSAASERRTFTISYRFRGLAVAHDDVVDVDLNVWGSNWAVGLDDLRASIALPKPAKLGPSYRVWGAPPWVNGVVARTPTAATLRAVNVPPHQFVEERVVFPRALLTSTAGAQVRKGNGLAPILAEQQAAEAAYTSDQAAIADARHHPVRTAVYLLAIALGPALALMLLVWLVFGRERRTDYDREYEQQPPDDTEPALVPPLLRQGETPGSPELTATLFDLIRRGYYKAAPVKTERSTWGGLHREEVADLELSPGDGSLSLAEFESPVAKVFDDTLEQGPERLSRMRERIEAHRAENSRRFQRFKKAVSAAIRSHKWYVGTGARALGALVACFVVAAVVLLWVGIDGFNSAAPRWGDVVLIAVGVCMAVNAVVLLVFATQVKLWRRRTKAGQLEAVRWEAFRRYLTDFPRLKDAPPATLELWERYLVYGIAFGIAERVLQGAHLHMPAELHDESSIYWISPNGDLGSGATALAIGDLSSGFGSALAPPSSSGSSGFGGGFSGGAGGGGGGGGGAW